MLIPWFLDFPQLEILMAGGSEERSLQETPTWAVAIVCGVFVIISIIIEHGIHSLGKVLVPIFI